jgi:hypothetical protein
VSIDTIYASLNQLAATVDYLEQEIALKEAELAEKAKAVAAPPPAPASSKSLPGLPGQVDLFGEWTAPGGKPANVNKAAQLAKKLDNAIENVQWLLKSAEA